MRFICHLIALLGLGFLANAAAAPALGFAAPARSLRTDTAALQRDAGKAFADSLALAGSFEEWDDETKAAPPTGELRDSSPRTFFRAASALSRPRSFARGSDRRTATLVGVVVFII